MHHRSDEGRIRAFHAFRIALARFGRTPDRLDPARRARLGPLAEKAMAVERRVLSSSRAGECVPADADVLAAVAEAEKACGGKAAFASVLAANGLTRMAFAAGAARELRFDAVMRGVGAAAPDPAESEIRAFFERHADRFRLPETRTLRHILITVNPDFPENRRAEAERRIAVLARRLKREPTAFEALARGHSECPTALEGGLVGTYPRGVLYPEIDALLFSLAPGDIAGPVETAMGFHLVRCDAVLPERTKEIDEAAGEIHEHLARTARAAAQRAWLAGLPE